MTYKKFLLIVFVFSYICGFAEGFYKGYYGEAPLVYKIDKKEE